MACSRALQPRPAHQCVSQASSTAVDTSSNSGQRKSSTHCLRINLTAQQHTPPQQLRSTGRKHCPTIQVKMLLHTAAQQQTLSHSLPTWSVRLLTPCHIQSTQHFHLNDLSCVDEENPHSPHFTPKKMYDVRDVARKAIQVNGPTGQNPTLRKERQEKERSLADTAQRIEAEQAAKAAAFTPSSYADKRCKKAGVVPSSKLTKTNVLAKFGLESHELEALGVPFETRVNPRNTRFAPMRIYKAGDVARALAKQEQMRQQARAQSKAHRSAKLEAARARSVAAAIQEA